MAISSKICRYIIPDSESDSNYEQFEFLLVWKGVQGSRENYMFTDWVTKENIKTEVINEDDSENMENLIKSSPRTVRLFAEDVSLTDFEAIKELLKCKKILRLYKDGTYERIGLASNIVSHRQQNKRYNIEFEIILYQKALPQ